MTKKLLIPLAALLILPFAGCSSQPAEDPGYSGTVVSKHHEREVIPMSPGMAIENTYYVTVRTGDGEVFDQDVERREYKACSKGDSFLFTSDYVATCSSPSAASSPVATASSSAATSR